MENPECFLDEEVLLFESANNSFSYIVIRLHIELSEVHLWISLDTTSTQNWLIFFTPAAFKKTWELASFLSAHIIASVAVTTPS